MTYHYVPSTDSSLSRTGHRSIVNTTLMHPHMPLILTAGVERHILLHSPTPSCPCAEDLPLTPTRVRELPGPNMDDRRRMLRALIAGVDRDDEQDDDGNTISLFDEYVLVILVLYPAS